VTYWSRWLIWECSLNHFLFEVICINFSITYKFSSNRKGKAKLNLDLPQSLRPSQHLRHVIVLQLTSNPLERLGCCQIGKGGNVKEVSYSTDNCTNTGNQRWGNASSGISWNSSLLFVWGRYFTLTRGKGGCATCDSHMPNPQQQPQQALSTCAEFQRSWLIPCISLDNGLLFTRCSDLGQLHSNAPTNIPGRILSKNQLLPYIPPPPLCHASKLFTLLC
jgi:hypothetical protein